MIGIWHRDCDVLSSTEVTFFPPISMVSLKKWLVRGI